MRYLSNDVITVIILCPEAMQEVSITDLARSQIVTIAQLLGRFP